jgi:segregation and condensation protein A
MMSDDSPFWATPPYILLTDVLQLDKVEPWNVDVGKLVGGFLDEMKRLGDIDFRISGNALYSASVIFMRKTRELVQLGLLPPEEDDDDGEIEIPLIRPPFRLTNRRVTLEELLVAMDHVLSKGTRQRYTPTKKKYRPKTDPLTFQVNIDQANIEETIADVYKDICNIMKIGDEAKFVEILMNNTRQEIVRVFFSLLFLFARAYIDIWMDENEVIWVRLLEPPKISDDDEEVSEEEIQPEIKT